MTIRILINGASGRMGSMAVDVLGAENDFDIVDRIDKHDDLFKSIQEHSADVVLDLTVASVVYENAKTILAAGARPVIGTSGLHPEQIEELAQDCNRQERGALIIPNFSIGAVLMMKFAEEASIHYPDVEIIEAHHPMKQDSPSGTALRTAQRIAKNKSQENQNQENGPSRGLKQNDIPIHAIRLPGIIAQQQVIFGAHGETLIIRHDTTDRKCFAPGIIIACRKVMELSDLVIGLESIL